MFENILKGIGNNNFDGLKMFRKENIFLLNLESDPVVHLVASLLCGIP